MPYPLGIGGVMQRMKMGIGRMKVNFSEDGRKMRLPSSFLPEGDLTVCDGMEDYLIECFVPV